MQCMTKMGVLNTNLSVILETRGVDLTQIQIMCYTWIGIAAGLKNIFLNLSYIKLHYTCDVSHDFKDTINEILILQ